MLRPTKLRIVRISGVILVGASLLAIVLLMNLRFPWGLGGGGGLGLYPQGMEDKFARLIDLLGLSMGICFAGVILLIFATVAGVIFRLRSEPNSH